MDTKEMISKICPFIRDNCIASDCIMFIKKDVIIDYDSGVWSDGVTVRRSMGKCRLWVDEQEK
jgi:hypothetical protein